MLFSVCSPPSASSVFARFLGRMRGAASARGGDACNTELTEVGEDTEEMLFFVCSSPSVIFVCTRFPRSAIE
jgi:hypothetical protein